MSRKMPLSQRWKQTSLPNKLMVFGTGIMAIATLALVVAAVFQYLTSREQSKAAQLQANIAKDQADIMKRQLDSMDLTLVEVRKEANAAVDAAIAAKDSASAARDAVRQNEDLIESTKIQANTSEVSARAAELSAQFARQSYEAGQQAKVFFKSVKWREKPVADKKFLADLGYSNAGATAYNVSIEMSSAVKPASFKGILPCDNTFTDTDEVLETGAEQIAVTDFALLLSKEGERRLDEGTALIWIYGHVGWEDSLRRKSHFAYCYAYNKTLYPLLMVCPQAMKIPDCAKRKN